MPIFNLEIPDEVSKIIDILESFGEECYIVGGCVRDSLLPFRCPHDWDICTSAHTDTIKEIFGKDKIIDTGSKHGTVTIKENNQLFEITTFRVDGNYSDGRHPDSVEFVRNLQEDLARRDFTINAMVYNHRTGMQDFFTGVEDMLDKKIRCVGNPDQRFQEDGLRIIRGLRFAARYNYTIDEETSDSMIRNREMLKKVSAERLAQELVKFLCSEFTEPILLNYRQIFAEIIPELEPMFDFDQKSQYHCHNIWEHTVKSITAIASNPILKLTMLLHDIGKPSTYTEDSNGNGHFYDHAKIGAEMANKILRRLKFDNETINNVTELVLHHGNTIDASNRNIKRWLNRLSEKKLRQLLNVKRADVLAQHPRIQEERINKLDEIVGILNEIIIDNEGFDKKTLEINGNDLIALGLSQGKQIGIILNELTELVIDGKLENSKKELLAKARTIAHRC